MPKRVPWSLLASIVIAQTAGLIGAIFTTPSIESWYIYLNKPAWNPPAWLFGPVWLILYTMMGLAAYLVWQKENSAGKKAALRFYGLQLVLNSLWSILFFGLKDLGLAFGEIIILWLMILVTILKFYKTEKIAAWLLVPYLLWVSFASLLNLAVWRLN